MLGQSKEDEYRYLATRIASHGYHRRELRHYGGESSSGDKYSSSGRRNDLSDSLARLIVTGASDCDDTVTCSNEVIR